MEKLNKYIHEAWSGVKKQSIKADIEAWCDELRIKNYTINSKGEIDVNESVYLNYTTFKELPYKFGTIIGSFIIHSCKNLISLKNCPYCVYGEFDCSNCSKLDSLEGCPKTVLLSFQCNGCKREFTEEEVQSLCKVKKDIKV